MMNICLNSVHVFSRQWQLRSWQYRFSASSLKNCDIPRSSISSSHISTVSVYSSIRIRNCHGRSDDFPWKTGAIAGGGRRTVCGRFTFLSDELLRTRADSLLLNDAGLLLLCCNR